MNAWFFPEVHALRPAILRITAGGYALYMLLRHGDAFRMIARQDPSVYAPVGPATLFTTPMDPLWFDAALWTTIGGLVLFVLGVGHRWLAPVTAALLTFVLAYRTSWGKVYHADNLYCVHVLALSLTPAASALSVDRWLERRGWLAALRWPALPRVDWRYGWSVQLVCALTVIAYFLAGWAKIHGDLGFAWATGDNLFAQIGKNAVQHEFLTREGVSDSVRWAFWLGPRLLWPMAVVALLVELLAPLVLVNRAAGAVWSVLTWCMHVGIALLMEITFWYPLTGLAFLPFLPVERVVPERWRDGPEPGAAG